MPNSAANASTQGSNAQVTFDPAVTAALGMGWHMSELYQEVAVLDRSLEPDPPDLPGLSALGSRQLIHLRFDQILSGLSRLSDKVSVGGLSVEDLKSQVTTAAVEFGPLESAPSAAGQTPSISTQHIRQVVLTLHIGILDTLTAVDACIGKAYGLGRALGDLTMRPAESSQNSFSTDFGGRVDVVKGWLHDLRTVLPDHAAVSVRLSLDIWKQWIADTSPTDSVWSEPAAWHDPLHPNSTLSVD